MSVNSVSTQEVFERLNQVCGQNKSFEEWQKMYNKYCNSNTESISVADFYNKMVEENKLELDEEDATEALALLHAAADGDDNFDSLDDFLNIDEKNYEYYELLQQDHYSFEKHESGASKLIVENSDDEFTALDINADGKIYQVREANYSELAENAPVEDDEEDTRLENSYIKEVQCPNPDYSKRLVQDENGEYIVYDINDEGVIYQERKPSDTELEEDFGIESTNKSNSSSGSSSSNSSTKTFEDIDTDGDGEISKEEYEAVKEDEAVEEDEAEIEEDGATEDDNEEDTSNITYDENKAIITIDGKQYVCTLDEEGNLTSLQYDNESIKDKKAVKIILEAMESDSYNDEFENINIETFIQDNKSGSGETKALKAYASEINESGGLGEVELEDTTFNYKDYTEGGTKKKRLLKVLEACSNGEIKDDNTALYCLKEIFGNDTDALIKAFRKMSKSNEEQYASLLFNLLRVANCEEE